MAWYARSKKKKNLSLQPDHYSYPSIFMYGHRAMGKSHVTLTLLRELQVRDALELQMPWRLLKALLNFVTFLKV